MGTSGRRVFALSYAVATLGVLTVNTINVLNGLQEARQHGVAFSPQAAILAEGSSGLTIIALVPLIWWAGRRWPPRAKDWLKLVFIHWACATGFSVLHVAGMLAIRRVFSTGRGLPFGVDAFLYEYRKDLLVYAIMLATGMLLRQWFEPRPAPPPAPSDARGPEPMFEIRDGARLIRSPVAEIAAAVSAGNYVEFKLVDGRTPLMRTTLAAVEAQLSPYGFTRTHRSWLVNAARVREIERAGSGDHRLALEGGVEAPLSRRYAEALERLRAPT